MIRRAFLVAAAAAALILTPSVAMADETYAATDYTVTVSDSTPNAGASFTVRVLGVVANAPVTLKTCPSDGARTLSTIANGRGVATFSVTLTQAGVCTLTARVAGVVVATQDVRVRGVSADAVPSSLSRTGFDGMPLAVGGGLLVLMGAGALVVAKRRKSAQVRA